MPTAEPAMPSPASDSAAPIDERTFERDLACRFPLRWHMVLMLGAAFSAGFLANHLLLAWPVRSAAIRWPIDLAIGYAIFVLCMRIWLAYVGARPFATDATSAFRAVRGSGSSWGGGGGGTYGKPAIGPGGGQFGGAGASESFNVAPASAGMLGGDHGASEAIGDAAHGRFDVSLPRGGGKGGPAILVAIAVVVVGGLLGSAAYLVVGAPHLLADVAFGAALTGAFAHRLRRASGDPNWIDSVFRATWKPFASIGILLFAAGIALQWYFPGARSLGEALLLLR